MHPPEAIDQMLLDVLQCPVCKGKLERVEAGLRCGCGLLFPIRDGIPIMVRDEAVREEAEPPAAE
ncbi:hypothetical protein Pan216_40800 [Planctomycetes bacterium Pan216]|uniref:Uncharacterized protein n=1 Tax=Kolteria novifilia TaxID=2527975 RepID=A0A518B8D6_9BACT|nr:hypothetical protein Pan216_40800 [Planctomycetes bacterium Pan216]